LPWEQVFRDRARLRKWYAERDGGEVKGVAQVRLPNGKDTLAEIHWYEAHGIGKKEFKLKLPFWISYEKKESAHFVGCRIMKDTRHRWRSEAYRFIPDEKGGSGRADRGLMRSGEDYASTLTVSSHQPCQQ